MQVNKKSFILSLVLVALLSFSVGYGLQNRLLAHKNPQPEVNLWVFKETPEGITTLVGGNIITDLAERNMRNVHGFDNETDYITKWISLGNSTILQTKTKLDDEALVGDGGGGFVRAEGSVVAWVNGGDFAYNVTKKFTALGNIAVDAAGLQWLVTSGSDNNLFALASLGGTQSFQNNWNCTIRWVVTWNAND